MVVVVLLLPVSIFTMVKGSLRVQGLFLELIYEELWRLRPVY